MTVSLSLSDLTIRFGGHVAVDAVSATFRPGELTVIVGPNGAGKTTCFNLVSGQLKPTSGQVMLDGRDISNWSPAARARAGIGRAFQLTSLFPDLSVLENVRLAVQAREGQGASLWRRARALTALRDEALQHLADVRLTDMAQLPVSALPHGDQRKLEVALLAAMRPRVFMFDEPTAGMSVDEAPAILDLIARIKGDPDRIVLLVEHKMDVVRALADRIIVLHNGALVADGPPDEVMALPVVREIYLGADAAAPEAMA
ncbi:ABC transporter ATP-binding protein [Oceanomicrobium pacificus]|uniref:ATP-binding cassette domain-containing protein n=1 Tax=Oceanomicrobium pacificus TaxID=2692916 RepID=A0A6B0U099_9RHOB|nr:ABC transporter ATP-binding protein [Oceanomicrobium pacificus]MXU66654.1 ATP-binding cassette domain-containing protein [Oceanomicrobium pacificus]